MTTARHNAAEERLNLPLKERFSRARQVVYLDTAAEGLPLDTAKQALVHYFQDKSLGTPGRRCLFARELEVVEAAARLLGTDHENVALVAHASEGLNILANSLSWSSGDEILVCDLEFPSNVLPWLRLRELGVTLRVVPSESGVIPYERLASQIHSRTKLVSISAVSYRTGTRIPYLAELARIAKDAGAVFAVDATQALGRIPISLEGVDYLVASSYKWLLGIHGLGVVYLAPEFGERLVPRSVGWYSVDDIFTKDRFQTFRFKRGAARLETGMPNFPAMYALRESLELLNAIGVDRIERELRPLVQQLRNGLEQLGVDLLTPADPELASGIVSFAHPRAEEIGTALERAGVIVWSGDGRVRASVHLYNNSADIARFLTHLEPILTQTLKVHD
jgi:cysteine desulfurase/selenocysteine lyase